VLLHVRREGLRFLHLQQWYAPPPPPPPTPSPSSRSPPCPACPSQPSALRPWGALSAEGAAERRPRSVLQSPLFPDEGPRSPGVGPPFSLEKGRSNESRVAPSHSEPEADTDRY